MELKGPRTEALMSEEEEDGIPAQERENLPLPYSGLCGLDDACEYW